MKLSNAIKNGHQPIGGAIMLVEFCTLATSGGMLSKIINGKEYNIIRVLLDLQKFVPGKTKPIPM